MVIDIGDVMTLMVLFAILTIYSYLLYPVFLKLLTRSADIDSFQNPTNEMPKVSLIIAAHNEESRINQKLDNTLTISYPRGLTEIIVASDFSVDRTDEIVEGYANEGIKLVRTDKRLGKEYAQYCALQVATGEIVVFTDVATMVDPEVVNNIIRYFDNNKIGAVSSVDKMLSKDGKIVGEGLYVRYEMALRRLESSRAGLVGLSGSLFAVKKELCNEWNIDIPSDFNAAITCVKNGKRAISADDVIGYYQDLQNPTKEFGRKVRTVLRGMAALKAKRGVLNPLRYGLFAYQVWSHKVMRWLVPWFMLALFITNAALIREGPIYSALLSVQVAGYIIILLSYFYIKLRAISVVRILYYFMEVNAAIFYASILFLLGRRVQLWTPSKR
jgi:glycosyltransferase involved in cell wall biosynthesis